ncbi:hypothetical protein [Aeromicrobium sp. 9AM]|uniref:hypothetical protein n=1 Tax=Aeromicrobium sp. 9AM TaxID=2653126 RepID=UPI0012F3B841|nr:hypothetical protein [Aeromicrobium sp. 9AM]VXC42054.1 conserved hypothetical protein [Aeromicrobium sp. 9AM]
MPSSLDDLLASSTPATTPRTAELDRELAVVVSAAEVAATAPSRRRKRIAIVSLATIGILGAGAAAGATGLLPTPWFDDPAARTTQTSPDGKTCDLAFSAKGLHDPAHPVNEATRAETIAAADAFLKGFDFSTIEQYKGDTMRAELARRLSAHLAQQGLPPEAVSVAAMASCLGSDQ